MSVLQWDSVGSKFYEAGVSRGALFVEGHPGVVWNGLINVSNGHVGGTLVESHINGFSYYKTHTNEETTLSIEAFTYPEEFEVCDGSAFSENGLGFGNQSRKKFDFSYRTGLGNDVNGMDHGYKIHFVYNCLASPANQSYSTLGESIDPMTFSWSVSTTAEILPNLKPTAYLFIDSTKAPPGVLSDIESIVYGTNDTDPRMPGPKELIDIFSGNTFKINENYTTGISTLTPMLNQPGESDLIGMYGRNMDGRVKPSSSFPGVYILE